MMMYIATPFALATGSFQYNLVLEFPGFLENTVVPEGKFLKRRVTHRVPHLGENALDGGLEGKDGAIWGESRISPIPRGLPRMSTGVDTFDSEK